MGRYSVVDVGSNTIHLLVGEVEDGSVLPITGEKVSARLGAGVEKTGRLEKGRLELAAGAIDLFSRIAALNGAPEPEVLATSAVRDAKNGKKLVEKVREKTGLKMRLISGKKEAELGFRGALSALGEDRSGKVLVVDLGGGSAQLIFGDGSGEVEERVSLPLGTKVEFSEGGSLVSDGTPLGTNEADECRIDSLAQSWAVIALRADFVNERLARHYGIPNVTGTEFRRVSLPPERRDELLQPPAVLRPHRRRAVRLLRAAPGRHGDGLGAQCRRRGAHRRGRSGSPCPR